MSGDGTAPEAAPRSARQAETQADPEAAPPAAPSRRIWAVASTVAAILLLYFAAEWFRTKWQEVAAAGPRPRIAAGWVVLGIVLLTLHAATSIRFWWQVVRATGARFSLRDATDTLMPALLARYVPGKVWANGARLFLSRRAGVSLAEVTGALLWEMGVVFATGGAVAFIALSFGAERRFVLAAALLCVASLVGIAGLSALAAVARRAAGSALARRLHGAQAVRSPLALAPAFGTAFAGWIAYGAAHVAFLHALGPAASAHGLLVAGAVTLAWAGGVLAVIAPAGLGVRDGLLFVMLGAALDPARALVYVALTRLAQFAVDLLLTTSWLAAHLTARRRARGA